MKKPIDGKALSTAIADAIADYAVQDVEAVIAHLAQKIGLLLALEHKRSGNSSDLFLVMLEGVNAGYALGGVSGPIDKLEIEPKPKLLQ